MTTQLLKKRQKKPTAKRGTNGKVISDIIINGNTHVPTWVRDHDSFRRWAFSDDFPQRGRFAFLGGKLWVDLSMETDVHNQIKTVFTVVLGSTVLKESLGRFFCDGMLLTNSTVGLSNEPDAMFVSKARLDQGIAVLKKGDLSMEVSGSPDMVLEVVSKSSVDKDKVVSVDLYAKAGIAEYWLVDSMLETPELVILRLSGGKYVTVRSHDGWIKSSVFGRSFRLTCKKDVKGLSQFQLETK